MAGPRISSPRVRLGLGFEPANIRERLKDQSIHDRGLVGLFIDLI